MRPRIVQLDYLRGLAALSIMLFHYFNLIFGTVHAGTFLGKLGVYGVSIFYILSGLTLCVVYKDKLSTTSQNLSFFLKRVFRIYPLMILVTIILLIFGSGSHSIHKIILNFTGLFGFLDPAGYIVAGLWSIGNELVFYALFPLMMFLNAKGVKYLFSFFLLSVVSVVGISVYWIDSNASLSTEWHKYVNPFNQLYLFCGGMLIVSLKNTLISNKAYWMMIAVGIIIFIAIPVGNEEILLVTGLNRAMFSIVVFFITWALFNANFSLNKYLDTGLRFLGDVSYSLYLWHSIIYLILKKISFINASPMLLFCSAVVLSFTISYFSYNFFERKAVLLGNKYFLKKK